ncbi:MAG: ATP-binding protein [Thermodesulfobacteriota bacterium]
MSKTRQIIEIDEELCDGCGLCIPSCAEGALQIINGKARLVGDKICDGLGACLQECPQGALRIIEREAEEFDPQAVEEHLQKQEQGSATEPAQAGGCPSSRVQDLNRQSGPAPAPGKEQGASLLGHWPIKIRLVPANAGFLQDAELLVAADCAPASHPGFQQQFLPGKALLLGCPKFDNAKEYVLKFQEIFQKNQIRSVTVLSMEVPCCSGLQNIVREGMQKAGLEIPLQVIELSLKGEILDRENILA